MFALTPTETDAIRLSLKVAFWSLSVSLPLAIVVATALARRSFPGKLLVNGLIHLPLVLPPVVTGYALLLLLGQRGAVGSWLESSLGIVLAFNWTGAAVAAGVMSFPLIVRPIRLSIEAVDPRLRSAAQTLGAGPIRTFLTITLPLALPGIIAGAILGFAKGLGEFGATITFVSNIPGETRTLALAVHSLLQTAGGEPAALRLTYVAIAIALAAIIASEVVARRLNAWLRGGDA